MARWDVSVHLGVRAAVGPISAVTDEPLHVSIIVALPEGGLHEQHVPHVLRVAVPHAHHYGRDNLDDRVPRFRHVNHALLVDDHDPHASVRLPLLLHEVVLYDTVKITQKLPARQEEFIVPDDLAQIGGR